MTIETHKYLDPEEIAADEIPDKLKTHYNQGMSMFTAGYSHAINKMAKDDVGYMLIAASAIDQYNNIEAAKATKQYGIRKGMEMFKDEGVKAVLKELKQFHDREAIIPKLLSELTSDVRRA